MLSHLLAESHGGERVQWVAALIWSLCPPFTMFLMSRSNVLMLAVQFVRGMAQGRKWVELSIQYVRLPLFTNTVTRNI